MPLEWPSMFSRFLSTTVFTLVLWGSTPWLRAHEAAKQMADTASALLDTLSGEAKVKAVFPFESEERFNWHFVPKERKGLPFKEMSPEQRLLAHALLNSGLSQRGYFKAVTIMSLEEVLFQIEGADAAKRDSVRLRRDPEKYYISIFGEPSMKGLWGWRLEGHHLALNFTVKDGELLRGTPCFFGSNPGEVRQGPRSGLRLLAGEEDLGRQLARTLTDAQWKVALVQETAFKDILTGASRSVKPLGHSGISEADLQPEQKALLHKLIKEHLYRLQPGIADTAWEEIQASGPVSFAWAGSREPKEGHYYSIQGKTFLLEYDNTQNDANHVHAVWRDFDSDFGTDLLGQHVNAEHK